MKINLNEFREKLNKVTASVKSKTVTLTILDDTDNIVISAVQDAFGVYLTQHGVEDGIPMNISLEAPLLRSMISLFVPMGDDSAGESLEIIKENTFLKLRAYGNELIIPYADLGTSAVDDKNTERYVQEIKVKWISYYINETAHALENTLTAVTGMEYRRTSFFLEMDKELKALRVTTTDSHRISVRSGAIRDNDVQYRFVIPGNPLKSAIALLNCDDEAVFRIPADGRFLQMVGKDMIVVLPVVGTSYYDINGKMGMFNAPKSVTFTVNKDPIINACEMVQVLDSKIKFSFEGNRLIMGTTHKNGQVEKTVMIEKEGNVVPRTATYNARFLADALKSIRSKRVDITVEPTNNVCQITPHVEQNEKPKAGKTIEIIAAIRA